MRRISTIFIAALLLGACSQQAPSQAPTATPATTPTPGQPATPPTSQADTPAHTAAIPQAQLIVPAHSIGLTHLNEPDDSVAKRLGTPDDGDAAMGKSLSTWYANHNPKGYSTSIFFVRQMGVEEVSRVQQIRITSPWFKTKEGICVGTDSTTISKHYILKATQQFTNNGSPATEYSSPSGIAFELDNTGHCIGIIVRHPGAGDPYLSFHS